MTLATKHHQRIGEKLFVDNTNVIADQVTIIDDMKDELKIFLEAGVNTTVPTMPASYQARYDSMKQALKSVKLYSSSVQAANMIIVKWPGVKKASRAAQLREFDLTYPPPPLHLDIYIYIYI